MPFMLLILAFLLYMVVWGFFHYQPKDANARKLLAYNVLLLIVSAVIAVAIGAWIHAGAELLPEKRHMMWYLTIMATGTAFMIVVAAGGMVRNFLVFPPGRAVSKADPGKSG